ncbi:HAD family phosphatase [Wukongibacter baidiensis]|uniref:HAD family hydrolase n=1 Tax=Wukongibacter baidiensis TaxID=1723361 RepID=UPI003D7FFDDE
MIKAIIFDMDGVIIDSEPIHKQVEKSIFERLDIEVSEEEHNSYVGKTSMGMWNEIKIKHNLGEDILAKEIVRLEVDRYIKHLLASEDIKPISGVKEFVNELYINNIKLALASSAVRRSIETVINLFELEEYFAIRISGEDIKNSKPCPDIFLEAAKELGVNPIECVVIEDSRNGVIAAKAAGMKCIGFKNPNSGDQDLSRADRVIDCFSQIDYKKIIEM